mgnify:CR=1 FL=1
MKLDRRTLLAQHLQSMRGGWLIDDGCPDKSSQKVRKVGSM